MRFLLFSLLVSALLATPAAAQEDDGTFLSRFLEDTLSEAGRDVTITGFRGALSSRARMDRLTISDDEGVWVTLRDVTMHWNRAAALRRRIQINEMTAAKIELTRLPEGGDTAPAPEATPFSLPDLPVSVNIDALRVDRVALGAAVMGKAVTFSLDGEANLGDGEGRARLEAERVDDAQGRFALAASYSNATRELALDLELAEEAGGIAAGLLGVPGEPSIAFEMQGEGPLDAFAADLRLETDGAERLAGRIELSDEGDADAPGGATQRFRADVEGDLAPLFAPDFAGFFGDTVRLSTAGAQHPDGRFELSDMTLSARALDIAGRVVVGADGLPEFVDVDLDIADPDGGAVTLPAGGPRTNIDSATLRVDFDADRGEDWRIDGNVAGLERPDMRIDSLRLWGDGRITRGTGDGRGVAGDLRFAADGIAPEDPALAQALGTEILGAARLRWSEGAPVELPSLALRGADYALAGSAEIDGERVDGRVTARLDDLARFDALAGQPIGGSLRGEIAGTAQLLSGMFDLDLALEGRDLASGQDELDGLLRGTTTIDGAVRRDTDGTTIQDLAIEAATLAARIDGTLRSTGTELTADLDFDDLSVLGPQYGGALTAQAEVTGGDDSEHIVLRGTGTDLVTGVADELDRLLVGRSSVELEATRRGEALDIERADLDAQSLTLSARGRYEPGSSDLTADLGFDDLSVLGPDYGGALTGTARLQESDGAERVTLRAEGTDLATGLADELDRLLRGASTLTLDATRRGAQIEVAQAVLDAGELSLNARGVYEPGASELTADIDISNLSALGPQYGGALTGRAELAEDGALRRLSLSADGRNLRVGQADADTLLSGRSRLSLGATEEDGRIRVEEFSLTNPQLDVTADAAMDGAQRRLNLSARLSDLGSIVEGFSGPVQINGTIDDAAPGGYRIDLSGRGPGELDVAVSGRMAQDLTSDLRVQGSAALGLANRFIDPISVLGTARFDLRVVGQPGLDAVRGTVTTEGARVVAPLGNIQLEDVAATAELGPAGVQIDARAGVGGGGRVAARGLVELTGRIEGDLRIDLDAVQLRDPELYDTSVSGELAIDGPLRGGAMISGALSLGETRIRVPSTGLGGTGYIPLALEHVNESAESLASRMRARLVAANGAERDIRPFGLDISVNAPNRIFIRGRGLDAELGGMLDITGTTRNIVPIGDFSLIRGRLDLLGNRFELTEGSAVLAGRLIPRLRLVATTETDGISASIIIEGPANAPEISFESTPALPEEEVVARILFGRGLDTLSPLQAAQLASAVATLAGQGGDGVVGRLRSSFGLDDLDVFSEGDDTFGVRAGAYITENVYTDVTLDSDGRSEVSVNLDLSRSVTVRARTDSEGQSGIGVFFERDY